LREEHDVADKKVIAVAGATGAQGGGLVRAILADPDGEFAVRAITRDPASEKARALAAAGAEVVAADVDNQATLERAFAGAYGAFCVTFFWDHFSPARELAQATNMANAAKRAGIEHAIWSTLEDSRRFVPLDDDRMPTLQGKYKVPHFDAKGEADEVFRASGAPTTYLLTSFYWENFIYFGAAPKPGPDGVLTLTMPIGEAKFPSIAAEDIGRSALAIFKAGKKYVGKYVGIAGEHLTGEEMAAAFTRALGRPVKYFAVDPAVYRGFGFPGADDLGNMFQFNRDFADTFTKARDLTTSRQLHPGMQRFDEWLAVNASRIPIE
jgi:uncharacterized protein YbjT (DUF2867 family)